MSPADRGATILAMRCTGGAFERRLADAWELADSVNAARLELAFIDIVAKFRPGRRFHVVPRETRGLEWPEM
jgi:hypothetical protein